MAFFFQYACGLRACPRRCRSRALPFWNYERVESPPSVNFDPDVGACLLELTRNSPRRHVCPQLSWRDMSVGTRFVKQNRLRDTGGGVISVVDWSEDPSTGGERQSASFGESCRPKLWSSWEPWRKIRGTTLSCLRPVRYLGFVDSFHVLCECDDLPQCDGKRQQHRWEQLQRTCHVHLITKRHVSQRWRREQQLSSIGLRRQVLRFRGISRSPVSFAFTLRTRCLDTCW